MTDHDVIERRLAELDERLRFLDRNPTLPGGEFEYRQTLWQWAQLDARREALRRGREWAR